MCAPIRQWRNETETDSSPLILTLFSSGQPYPPYSPAPLQSTPHSYPDPSTTASYFSSYNASSDPPLQPSYGGESELLPYR